MSLIIHIKVFNDILEQFFEFLETEFEDFKSDIILTRAGVDFIRQTNPRLVIEQFMTMVEPFKSQIFNCDEEFFLDFKLLPGVSSEQSMLHSKVKKIWTSNNINNTQKAYIWLYFQKLIKAGEKLY
jgi:hypothetical protein